MVNLLRSYISGNGSHALSSRVKNRASVLEKFWAQRQTSIREWYDIIKLKDYLEQENMESFISNQPKNTFRFARHLIANSAIHDRIIKTHLTDAQTVAALKMERALALFWRRLEKRERDLGRQGWMWQVAGYMTAMGWYAVFAGADEDSVWAEVWNPYQVFPLWHHSKGLIEVCHSYSCDIDTAKLNLYQMGHGELKLSGPTVRVIDFWELKEGIPTNTLLYNDTIVKGEVPHSYPRIPIFTGPASGMPDMGVLPSNSDWAGSWGESVVAHNVGILENFNKFHTYMMQIIRDTANPAWIEYLTGQDSILDEDKIFKRGAIFSADSDERVEPLAGPALPVEATSILGSIADFADQGGFPRQVLGTINQPVSSVMLSQLVGSTQHLIKPYSDATEHLRASLHEFWFQQMKHHSWKPYSAEVALSDLPDSIEFSTSLQLNIPGDLTNRATQARMLNPAYEMSIERITALLFPAEIPDSAAETASRDAERAMRHPVAQDLQLIEAYEEAARRADAEGNTTAAARWRRAAQAIEQSLGQRVGGQQPETVEPSTQVSPPNPFVA